MNMIATLSRIRTRTGRIGLEFDGSGLRCAQVRRSGAGWKLVRSRAVSPTLDDNMDDAPAFATTDLLMAAAGFTGGDVATVLPMSNCELRVFEVPQGTHAELQAMVAGEMESSTDTDAIVDFWQLPADASSRPELTSLCALAANKPAIANAAQLIQAGGYSVTGIDSLPTACARAAELWRSSTSSGHRPVGQSLLSVHVGWDRCTLVLSNGGPPEIARVPQLPGLQGWLLDASQLSGTEPGDVLQIVQGLHDGLPLRASSRLLRGLEGVTSTWSRAIGTEIFRTLTFLRKPGSRSIPSTALLMGGGAMIPGLANCLEQELNIETLTWDLPCEGRTRGGAEFAVAAALSAWEIRG